MTIRAIIIRMCMTYFIYNNIIIYMKKNTIFWSIAITTVVVVVGDLFIQQYSYLLTITITVVVIPVPTIYLRIIMQKTLTTMYTFLVISKSQQTHFILKNYLYNL